MENQDRTIELLEQILRQYLSILNRWESEGESYDVIGGSYSGDRNMIEYLLMMLERPKPLEQLVYGLNFVFRSTTYRLNTTTAILEMIRETVSERAE